MKEMKDGGGLAFPIVFETQSGFAIHLGMTLRDWFAGQAMQGEIISQGLEGRDPEHIAGMAYEMADAMIAERSKP